MVAGIELELVQVALIFLAGLGSLITYGLHRWYTQRRMPSAAAAPDGDDYAAYLEYLREVRADQVAPPQVLATATWLHLVNEQPDRHPHLLIVGKSGSGKTTLARALLSQRTGEVCVLTPKLDDDWGVPVVTLDDDASFTTLTTTLEALYKELLQRGATTPPLTVVLDDYPILSQDRQTKDACITLVRSVARLGRSKRMRLLLLTHETTARATGTAGEHALLANLTRIDVDKHTHQATLTDDEQVVLLDTRYIPQMATLPLVLHAWQQHLVRPALCEPALVRSHDVNVRSGHGNEESEPFERSRDGHEAADLPLPQDLNELRKLAKALVLYGEGKGKQASIEQSFGVRKGGGKEYKRAYTLFTTAVSDDLLAVERGVLLE